MRCLTGDIRKGSPWLGPCRVSFAPQTGLTEPAAPDLLASPCFLAWLEHSLRVSQLTTIDALDLSSKRRRTCSKSGWQLSRPTLHVLPDNVSRRVARIHGGGLPSRSRGGGCCRGRGRRVGDLCRIG